MILDSKWRGTPEHTWPLGPIAEGGYGYTIVRTEDGFEAAYKGKSLGEPEEMFYQARELCYHHRSSQA